MSNDIFKFVQINMKHLLYLDDILLQLYVIYLITKFISVDRLCVTVARQPNMTCQRGAFML